MDLAWERDDAAKCNFMKLKPSFLLLNFHQIYNKEVHNIRKAEAKLSFCSSFLV
jgi:hypothetical protein